MLHQTADPGWIPSPNRGGRGVKGMGMSDNDNIQTLVSARLTIAYLHQ